MRVCLSDERLHRIDKFKYLLLFIYFLFGGDTLHDVVDFSLLTINERFAPIIDIFFVLSPKLLYRFLQVYFCKFLIKADIFLDTLKFFKYDLLIVFLDVNNF